LKRAIYDARLNGMSIPRIAARFAVGVATVHRIAQMHERYGVQAKRRSA
jgi:transposase